MNETPDQRLQKSDDGQPKLVASRINALQAVIDQLHSLSQRQSSALPQAIHDVRSSFSLVNAAAYLLQTEFLSEADRTQFMTLLNRNLTRLQDQFIHLMNLAHSEAGEDQWVVDWGQAAQLLTELVASTQSIAGQLSLDSRAGDA